MRWFLIASVTLLSCLAPMETWADTNSDHIALKTLLKNTQQAFNTKNFELLMPYIASGSFTVITIDGHKLESLKTFQAYWHDILHKSKTGLERIEVNPIADGPTEFLAENVGICHGTSNDRYYFTGGDIKTMPERWTAVLLKEGGVWKISRIIFSANILDNPVLSGTRESMGQLILWAALGGLLTGALGMWLIRYRKTI